MTRRPTLSADEFRSALADLGITQQRFAELAGYHSHRRISEFCRGVRPVTPQATSTVRMLQSLPERERRKLITGK